LGLCDELRWLPFVLQQRSMGEAPDGDPQAHAGTRIVHGDYRPPQLDLKVRPRQRPCAILDSVSALLANADAINRIRDELYRLRTLDGAPALARDQVDQLLELIREAAELPPFPWTEERSTVRSDPSTHR
jgi:hypothetical protein